MERFKIFKDNSLKNKIAIIFDNKFILDDAKNIEIIRVRIDRARTKYERICELAKKEYDSILRLENDKYKNGERLFFREYDEKVKPLERNYYKVRSYLEKKFDSERNKYYDLCLKKIKKMEKNFNSKKGMSFYILRNHKISDIQTKYNNYVLNLKKKYDYIISIYWHKYSVVKKDVDDRFNGLKNEYRMKLEEARKQRDIKTKEAYNAYKITEEGYLPVLDTLIKRQKKVQFVKRLLKLR